MRPTPYQRFFRLTLAVGVVLMALQLATQPQSGQDSTRQSDGPTVLITGSNRGIGLAFARQYAEKGWNVIATARNPEAAEALQALVAEHPTVVIERLDVTDHAALEALAQDYRDRPIDVLIKNAGVLGALED